MLGTWRGTGEGHYPTITDFAYAEELVFSHVGKPFVMMWQKSRNTDTGEPLHAETGYFRPQPDATVELVLAQPSGILEVDIGRVTSAGGDGVEISLESQTVVTAPSARPFS